MTDSKITDIFPVNSVGIVTARDNLTIHWSENDAWTTVQNFARMDPELARQGYDLGKDARDWKVELAQKDLNDSGPSRELLRPILYRPFDTRFTYYTGRTKGFHCMPRREVMQHMMQENLALISARSNKSQDMDHFFVTQNIMETKCGESTTQSYIFPLYVFPEADPDKQDLFTTGAQKDRQPNIPLDIFAALKAAYGTAVSPEDIFHYIYAVLYAPAYRTKYAEFLKTDFPRVPFTADSKLFHALAQKGEELVALHLLKSPALETPSVTCPHTGTNEVEKPSYDEKQKRLYFNTTQYFAPLSAAVWEYQIGGYQVCAKWLKDRKSRRLSAEDIRHACRFMTAIEKTVSLQKAIDALYPAVEKSILPVAVK